MTMTSQNGEIEVDVPMPPRSLLVMSGDARYLWKHSIRRSEITERRLCITIRELSSEFVASNEQLAEELFNISKVYL